MPEFSALRAHDWDVFRTHEMAALWYHHSPRMLVWSSCDVLRTDVASWACHPFRLAVDPRLEVRRPLQVRDSARIVEQSNAYLIDQESLSPESMTTRV